MTEGLYGKRFPRKAATAALVLATHALFLLLLQVERRGRPRPLPLLPEMTGIAIRLFPVAPVAPARPEEIRTAGTTPPAAPRIAISIAMPLTSTAPTEGTGPEEAPATPVTAGQGTPAVDWYAQAAALAARHAEESEKPSTFSDPPQVMRRPCTSRRFDAATTREMAEVLPRESDPIPVGGFRSSTVNMGGVIVRERALPPPDDSVESAGAEDSKRSFKWAWDSKDDKMSWLTLGWEPNAPYDGMFDDMQAGRTPESSVPHHEKCD